MSRPPGVRRRPRPLAPGKAAEIGLGDYVELQAARADLAAAKLRLRRVTARLELAIGDAEFATVDGRLALWRERSKTGGGYIPVNYRDDLRVIPNVDPNPGTQTEFQPAGRGPIGLVP